MAGHRPVWAGWSRPGVRPVICPTAFRLLPTPTVLACPLPGADSRSNAVIGLSFPDKNTHSFLLPVFRTHVRHADHAASVTIGRIYAAAHRDAA